MTGGEASVASLLPVTSSSSFTSSSTTKTPSPSSPETANNSGHNNNSVAISSCDIHLSHNPLLGSPSHSQYHHHHRRNKRHHSPLPRTRLFDDHNNNSLHHLHHSQTNTATTSMKSSIMFPFRKKLHTLQHYRRYTLSQALSCILVALMLLSVWTTLGMTLVLLGQLDTTPFLSSFPTTLTSSFSHYHQSESSTLRRRQQQQIHRSKPRVVYYTQTNDEFSSSFSSSSSSSSSTLVNGLPPLLRPDTNDTSFVGELLSLSSHDERMMIPSQQQDEHSTAANDNPECVPMAAWQTQSFPSCNILHEIDLTNVPLPPTTTIEAQHNGNDHNSSSWINHNHDALYILGRGWFRITWRYDAFTTTTKTDHNNRPDASTESVVLKTLRLDRDFSAEFYELHRRDAVAMERLTFSPHVMNIYGYCGQSALNELADFNVGGMTRLEELSRRLREQPHTPHLFMTKLRLAYQVAMALYHVHELPNNQGGSNMKTNQGDVMKHNDGAEDDDDETETLEYKPVMVHYDVNPRNVALVRGGRAKLNDFNTCEFLTWNPNTRATCGFRGRFHEPWWRSPEEMPPVNATSLDVVTAGQPQPHLTTTRTTTANTKPPLQETVDIYALGNILFHILTTHSPRGKMKAERLLMVQGMVTQGQRPPLPLMFQLVVPNNSTATVETLPEDANYSYLQYYEHYNATTPQEVAIVAFLQAMDGCYPMDPAKRMTARQVARIFRNAMRRMNQMVTLQQNSAAAIVTTTTTRRRDKKRNKR